MLLGDPTLLWGCWVIAVAVAVHLWFRWRRHCTQQLVAVPPLRSGGNIAGQQEPTGTTFSRTVTSPAARAPVLVVVTGGCGLLGRWVVHALVAAKEGFHVRVIDTCTLDEWVLSSVSLLGTCSHVCAIVGVLLIGL